MALHHKEQQIIDCIKKVTVERQAEYLHYRLKYGRYKNMTLHDMFQSRQGTQYILFLKNNTKNSHLKSSLILAAREEQKLNSVL